MLEPPADDTPDIERPSCGLQGCWVEEHSGPGSKNTHRGEESPSGLGEEEAGWSRAKQKDRSGDPYAQSSSDGGKAGEMGKESANYWMQDQEQFNSIDCCASEIDNDDAVIVSVYLCIVSESAVLSSSEGFE
ncbi:hypothetical protein FB451DRAFT_1189970 [Mycena latifolia]|nr:hypothetical protein FB451DRAFT_1189970 [Mycena latifolia]